MVKLVNRENQAFILIYLAAPCAIQAAMTLASASLKAWAGMGMAPHTPAPPALILPAK